jgi:hypothetical protein
MSTTDDLGVWDDLGTINVTDDWQIFPNSSFKANAFRLTFLTDWNAWELDAKYKSYGIIRLYYPTIKTTVSRTTKIFVTENSQIIQLPFVQLTELFSIGVKRVVWSKYYYKKPTLPQGAFSWGLKIQSLLSSATNQLDRIEQKIDDISNYRM